MAMKIYAWNAAKRIDRNWRIGHNINITNVI